MSDSIIIYEILFFPLKRITHFCTFLYNTSENNAVVLDKLNIQLN